MIEAIDKLPNWLPFSLFLILTIPMGIWGVKSIRKDKNFDGKIYSLGLITALFFNILLLIIALYKDFFQK